MKPPKENAVSIDPPGKVAVIIPCHNEEETVGQVIDDFKQIFPLAEIVLIDNNCTDKTRAVAQQRECTILFEVRKGKGFALNRIPENVIADYYVIVDGDGTYPASVVPQMIDCLRNGIADMVVGNRQPSYHLTKVRRFHGIGNNLVKWLINLIFRANVQDPLSGLRALNRNSILSMPFIAGGFDIETEITIQALQRKLVIQEVDIEYQDRPPENPSKLNTFRDGAQILVRLFLMAATYKPLTLFGIFGCLLFLSGTFTGVGALRFESPNSLMLGALTGLFTAFLGLIVILVGIIIHILNNRLNESQKLITRNLLLKGTNAEK